MQTVIRHAVLWVAASAVVLTGGCASRSTEVAPRPTDPALYRGWDCDRLFDESDAVQLRAADVAYSVDARAGNNMIALGLGVTVFWPALLAMRADGPEAEQLAELKGRFEALQVVRGEKSCGAPPEVMAAARVAALPVATGDRLVYDDRRGSGSGAGRELGMRVTALRRDHIEFDLDVDGRQQPGSWHQDLVGNPLPGSAPVLMSWQRLLRPGLELGQVLAGDLAAAHVPQAHARVRGQVVAIGPQQVAGRQFDVAVIELFGDAPVSGMDSNISTRLDGVMAVDRASGVLLRLELRCANADFALRRRLLRVEPAQR